MSTRAVPDAVAPPPRHPRFPLIDGTRAIAVICIVVLHAAVNGPSMGDSLAGHALNHLNVGVTIFFVISGFLLYRPFIAHRGGGGPAPAVASYARRRFLRIYPAYALVLTVLILIPGLTAFSGVPWWKEYGLIQTLPVGGTALCGAAGCGLAQTWSLVVELTFYAALPLYVFAADWLARRPRPASWIARELALLAALSLLSILVGFDFIGTSGRWFSVTVLIYLPWFALGMGMAIASVGMDGRPARTGPMATFASSAWVLWGGALAIYAALCAWLPPTTLLLDRDQRLVAFLGFGAIGALVVAPAIFAANTDDRPRRVLANPLAAWLGLISYGIFLWHLTPAMKLGTGGAEASFPLVLAGTLAITIPIAALSYYVVERPLLRFKEGRGRPHSSRRGAEPVK